jgi:hypothetical protein
MAFIRLKTGQCKVVPPRKAAEVWLVYTGEMKGTPAQKAFVKQIDKIYLNRSNAPKSYIERHPDKSRPELEQTALVPLAYKDAE